MAKGLVLRVLRSYSDTLSAQPGTVPFLGRFPSPWVAGGLLPPLSATCYLRGLPFLAYANGRVMQAVSAVVCGSEHLSGVAYLHSAPVGSA